jgi:hypothetical protein
MMVRGVLCALLGVMMLVGCGKKDEHERDVPTSLAVFNQLQLAHKEKSRILLAYSHQIEVEMAPERVVARYEELKDLCLNDQSLGCTLLDTVVRSESQSTYLPRASLKLRLPHNTVPKFEQLVLAPAGTGRHATVKLRSRSTNAEDLTAAITDADRRMAQLTDYRERLTALAKRADVRTEELIKIEGELSKTQQQIEELSAEQRGLNQRVDTELLTVEIYEATTLATGWKPVGQALSDAGQTLGENIGEAIRFTLAALPFIPLIAVACVLAAFGWKLFRLFLGRRAAPQGKSPPLS